MSLTELRAVVEMTKITLMNAREKQKNGKENKRRE
jgi:hypothetical protein